jgi:threonine dehydrogenase-like Zn-dependent dehydrogenase
VRAAVFREHQLIVDEIPDPIPGAGQVLVETIANGICGTDLHLVEHAEEFIQAGVDTGVTMMVFDPHRDLVLGHEYSARVLELGPDVTGLRPGDVVVGGATISVGTDLFAVGYTNDWPGGYGELMVLNAEACLAVPNGLDPRHAALTEPMSVGLGSVTRSGVQPGQSAVVYGCGPVGLSIVSALVVQGIDLIVATDFSAARRDLALRMGAHVAVDPREERAIDAWQRVGGAMPLVVFEAVGVPGMIDSVLSEVPFGSRVVVTGACMAEDRFRPMLGMYKAITLQFSPGYTPQEFAEMLRRIAEGIVDVSPLITGEVGLTGVPDAFSSLRRADTHAKILIEPALG